MQVALEQDGLGLERVAGPVCTSLLKHAGVERSRRKLERVLRLGNNDNGASSLPDPGLQQGRFPADLFPEVGRQGRKALGVQGNLPLQDFIQTPSVLETDRSGRDRLASPIISHIDGVIIALPSCGQREGLLHVRGPPPIFLGIDVIRAVRQSRNRRFHRIQGIEPPVPVPEGDRLTVFVRDETQPPPPEIAAGQND